MKTDQKVWFGLPVCFHFRQLHRFSLASTPTDIQNTVLLRRLGLSI
nr:MAG TPA: hypothetical protein [Bacteriophage sp.]